MQWHQMLLTYRLTFLWRVHFLRPVGLNQPCHILTDWLESAQKSICLINMQLFLIGPKIFYCSLSIFFRDSCPWRSGQRRWVSMVPGEHCQKIAVSNLTQAGQRFTWSKTWCGRQQLWKAVIIGDKKSAINKKRLFSNYLRCAPDLPNIAFARKFVDRYLFWKTVILSLRFGGNSI